MLFGDVLLAICYSSRDPKSQIDNHLLHDRIEDIFQYLTMDHAYQDFVWLHLTLW